jgi:hypothetical protein
MSKKNKPAPDVTVRIDAAIAAFGWAVVAGPDKDGFAYTVGLTETRLQAELCLHGVADSSLAVRLLDQLARKIVEDDVPPLATRIPDLLRDLDVMLLAADKRARERATYAVTRYGAAVRFVQCVLPDANNRFPWNYDVDRWQTFGQIVMAPLPKDDTPDDKFPTAEQIITRIC